MASSSVSNRQRKHKVFISFRGEDVRKNFLSHLVPALERRGIDSFIDNKIEKGEEISPALWTAIDDAEISIVVLSRNFTSSSWCLDELSRIIERKKYKNQIVAPIFYHIPPSEVRDLAEELKKPFLKEVANIVGWCFQGQSMDKSEYEFVEEIATDISKKLTEKSSNDFRGYLKGFAAPIKTDVGKELPTIQVPVLSLDELKERTDNFGSKALIGRGCYGRVYYAILKDGKALAIQLLDVAHETELNDDFLSQVSMLSRLKHENLVELRGYSVERNVYALAYDFATMGSLYDILHGREGVEEANLQSVLDWKRRVRIAIDAARGLEYLHDKVQPSMVHRDIRSKTVLLFEDFRAKIVAFALLNKSWKTHCITDLFLGAFGYNAPEQKGGEVTQKSDVYGFGVVLLELLTGRSVIDNRKPSEEMYLVSWATPRLAGDRVKECVDPKLNGEYPSEGVAKLAAVAASCLQYEAELRPNMSVVVNALQQLLKPSERPTWLSR